MKFSGHDSQVPGDLNSGFAFANYDDLNPEFTFANPIFKISEWGPQKGFRFAGGKNYYSRTTFWKFQNGVTTRESDSKFSERGSRVTKMREPRLVKRREPHSENFSMEFAGEVPSRVVKTDEPYSENFRMGFVGGKNARIPFWKFQNWIHQVTTNFLTTHQQTTSDRNVETQSIAKMNPPRCYYFRNSVIPHWTIMLKQCNVLTFANAIEPASA